MALRVSNATAAPLNTYATVPKTLAPTLNFIRRRNR